MTSINPSHLPQRSSSSSDERLHGQAVHEEVTAIHPHAQAEHAKHSRDAPSHAQGSDVEPDEDTSVAQPLQQPSWRGAWARRQAQKQKEKEQREKEARAHGKIPVPPIPDLRYEQGVLMSIRPFLHSTASQRSGSVDPPSERHTEKVEAGEKGALVSQALTAEGAKQGIAVGSNSDIFSGPLRIEWPQVVYVIVRDQFVYPLLQGLLWGVGGMWLNSLWAWNRHRLAGKSSGAGSPNSGPGLLARLGIRLK
ncbi:hypothetical protein OIO90_000820 [Microbotryomycetes sp. JL221]|nr:hypothetical protein OIO90_000820 [Microbotryomycetes sp. JL221]